MNESIDGEGTKFFHVPFACELMQKSTAQVLEKCEDFGAELFTAEDILASTDDMKSSQAVPPEFLKVMKRYTNKVSFKCTFELHDYQAISFVSINFINAVAVECVISLGRPINIERYSSEESVLRVFLVSLEKLYLNGRIQQDYLEERVYTWKKDNRTLVSFVSYPPSGPASTGQFLGVQIRDTQLYPQGNELELLYNKAQKHVENLKLVQEDRRGIPFEKIYKNRRSLYMLTSLLFTGMIVLSIGGIFFLFSKHFVAAIGFILFGALCGYFTSKLHDNAVKDYLHERYNKADTSQEKENC